MRGTTVMAHHWLMLILRRQFSVAVVASLIVAAVPLAATAQQPETLPIAWVAPPGVEQTSDCRPGIGERWRDGRGRSETGVAGPTYFVNQGRLVGVEYEVSQADLSAGSSWRGIALHYWGQPLTIDHIDIRFTPAHEGFEEPHYGIVSWLVNPAERAALTCQP